MFTTVTIIIVLNQTICFTDVSSTSGLIVVQRNVVKAANVFHILRQKSIILILVSARVIFDCARPRFSFCENR